MTARTLSTRCRTSSRRAGHSLAECALVVSFLCAITVVITSVLGPQLQGFAGAVIRVVEFAWNAI